MAHTASRIASSWLALVLAAAGLLAPAAGHAASSTFDHYTTGFELLGEHRGVPCASCHVGGIFKGTPHDCFSCHSPGSRIGAAAKPTNHIISNNDCAQCHTPFSWIPVARFNHLNVFGSCSSCHNNVQTIGKPARHVPTTAECNQCHVVTKPWTALNYPSNHIPTSPTSTCTNCHTGSDFSVVPTLDNIHQYAPSSSSNCAQCHGSAAPTFAIPAIGFSVVGVPATHVPTQAPCESCHVGAGSSVTLPVATGAKFGNSAFSHAGITSNCVTCHGPNVSGSSFYGINSIVVFPSTASGATSHVPSGQVCESCHAGATPAGLVPANATKVVPGTGFQTPPPTTAMIHSGITSGCNSCHENTLTWADMAQYPLAPAALSGTPTTQYTGFNLRPSAAGGAFILADNAHPTSGDCSQCHKRTDYFEGNIKPANHIPYAATAQCTDCHKNTDFSVWPALADIHANAQSTTTNCIQCHGSTAASFAIPAANNFAIKAIPAKHVTSNADSACETCHVGATSSIKTLPVPNGSTFANSAMSHAGITSNCVSCHGSTIGAASFYGINSIVVFPSTTSGATSHVPSGQVCESCHAGSTPAGLVPANATKVVPGTAFQTPAPTTAMIHSGVTSGCNSCHENTLTWADMNLYPLTPSALTGNPTSQYTGFNLRPSSAGGAFILADNAHPTSGDCSQCHTRTDYFEGNVKPSNHIPYSATAQCTDCHKSTDFSVWPALSDIHANAQSTTTNCIQCHGSAAASFAIPAANNFKIVAIPSKHVTSNADSACETCHVGATSSVKTLPVPNGSTFANSAMSHAGITSNCVSCHGSTIGAASFYGINSIVVFPSTTSGATSHVPSGQVCESCHAGSTPAGLVPANATKVVPGTAFQTPAPTTAMIHSGVTSGCNSCHENTLTWADMNLYPLTPSALTGNPTTQYTGFNLRPNTSGGASILADNAHPPSGDCSQCHTRTDYFEGNLKPSNHIPYVATAQCTDCHKNPDFSVWPALVDIHANAQSTTTNCIQCHGSTAGSFAIPAANNFKIVAIPSKHVTSNADSACETCHVGATSSIKTLPVPNGSTFANSAMSHAGITSNCVSCHGSTIGAASFYGINSIVVFPSTTSGATSHVPSGQVCENCHAGSTPSGLVPGNATKVVPGTAFQTPAPTTAMIHSGVTSGCTSCHENTLTWADMNLYPLAPSALTGNPTSQYTGFNLRPSSAGGAFILADNAHPTSGDCSQCHARTDYFEANVKPSNHIPYSATAQCTDCHKSTDFSVWPALSDIHANAQSTTTNCIQCHGSTAGSFAIPAANNFKIVAIPSKHVTSNADSACETCHVGATSSIKTLPVPNGSTFANSAMSHAGITSNCVSCHGSTIGAASFYGINSIVVFPSTTSGATSHVPSGQVCESCHAGSTPAGLVPANATKVVPGTAFQTPVPTTAMIHAGITSGCTSCHENTLTWADMNLYPLTPSAVSTNASTQYTGFNLRPNTAGGAFILADKAHPTSGDCSQCHTRTDYFEGNIKPSNHIPYSATAQCTNCHTSTDFSVIPTLLNIHTYAQSTTTNCAQCHGSAVAAGFAIPAANFSIVTTPGNHVPTTASCEVCHLGAGSSFATLPVPNGSKFTGSAMSHSGITTNCVTCHGPTVTGLSFAGITKIVVMPPTSPMGIGSHIPSGTTCETCHAGSTPSGLVPANATKTAPGTSFATPVPTTGMIHTGITSGCTSCHEAGDVWMTMNVYPITPTAVTGLNTTQYMGFQTRPVAAASTYSVADAAHPATGDCVQCHVGTAYFSPQAEPPNHIPTLPGAQCGVCHTTAGNFAVYTTNMTVLHTEVSTACSTCHSDGKTFAGATGPNSFKPVEMSTRGLHIPITNVGAPVECSGCHKSVTAFTGTIMSHAAIGDTGVSATGNACDACHEYGYRSKFYGVSINWVRDSATHHICGPAGTPTAPNITPCTGGGSDCLQGCHEHQNQIPSKYASVRPGTPKQIKSTVTPTTPAPAAGGARRPGLGSIVGGRLGVGDPSRVDHTALGGAACQGCHNGTIATGKAAGHPATTVACRDCHSTLAWQPVLHVDHADVLGACASCHDGAHATGKSPAHPMSGTDCDRCHTTSAWKPAAFDHKSVLAGSCATCHNALTAPGKPAAHVMTQQSCDACHYVLGWKPVKPAALPPKPAKKPVTRPAPTPRGRDSTPLAPPL